MAMDCNRTPLFILVTLLAVSLNYQHVSSAIIERRHQQYYGILVDAGSSSSKMKIYKWSAPKSVDYMPKIEFVEQVKFKTPITDFTDDPEGLSNYVDDMLIWGAENIPEEKHSSTPILLQATAGMRFLESEVTYDLLSQVREILSNSSRNPFAPITHDDVSVLSGEEEGVYSWIAANYLLGFFDSKKPVSESVGIMEMGGGSTQIAFIPEGPVYDGEFQVRLANRRYSIYVHSYLNFGVNGMKREIADHILSEDPTSDHVLEPCVLKDDKTTISLEDGVTVEVIGDSNATRCHQVLQELMKPVEGIDCQPKPCVIREVYQPDIGNGHFYATSAFAYAPKHLNAVRGDGTLDLEQLFESGQEYCALTLEEAVELYPNNSPKYLSGDCMMANYIPTLLQHYGFSLDTHKVTLTSKIGSEQIDWALGSMLMKLSDRFANRRGDFSVQFPKRRKMDNLGGAAASLNSQMS